ncbi:DUF3465 domain-containing protein [Bdellovibrio sp. HCB337]|uniref:DUF3465 domain-containing protein n=1 Tax=Bdellovibrio sp. HCB337 TaxID=3394358 RepID=UPI0039A7244F
MTKKLALMLGVVLSVSCFQAKSEDFVPYGRNRSHKGNEQKNENRQNRGGQDESRISDPNAEDKEIVKAVEKRRRADFVEGRGMVVVKLLPDDRNGLQHQKWVVRLSNGTQMQAVYNLDLCEYVPLKVGDVIAMGGQFVWTNQGALLHWLHYDPRERRPDGYVELNGKVYCGDGERHN